MVDLLGTFKHSSFYFWQNDDKLTSEQFTGLTVLFAFTYSFVQKTYAPDNPQINYGATVLLIITILVLLYYSFGWLVNDKNNKLFSYFLYGLRIQFIHLFLTMLVVTTDYTSENLLGVGWLGLNLIVEYSPWSESLISSAIASCALLMKTVRSLSHEVLLKQRNIFYLSTTILCCSSLSFMLMALWVIPIK